LAPVERAEVLMRGGQVDSALQQLTMLRDSLSGTRDGARAQYLLGYLNVFSSNPQPDWAAALSEFRRFMSEYPGHELAEDANAWVRLLTEIETLRTKERMRSERVQELLKSDMFLQQVGGSQGVTVMLDSMQRCTAQRDSMAARIKLLEEVIQAIEKGP